MANYHRGPNVTEFIANLNAIPSAQDSLGPEDFNLDADLAMFTNTQFFDFDLGQDTDFKPSANFDFQAKPQLAPEPAANNAQGLEFMPADYTFPDFAFPAPDGLPNAPVAPHLQGQQPVYPASDLSSPRSGLISPQNGLKRPSDAMTGSTFGAPFEESSRMAAEEDKRRRNTAASARFRVKKKQREQALEKSAKEMADKVAALEGRIAQLETENKWLKGLITEKNESKDDIAALWKKYNQETGERKASESKAGVGTTAGKA